MITIYATKNTGSTSGKTGVGSHWHRIAYHKRLRWLFLIFAIGVLLVSLVAGIGTVLAVSPVALGSDNVSSTYSHRANEDSRPAHLLQPSVPFDTPTTTITPAGPATATNTPAGTVAPINTPTSTPTGATATNTPAGPATATNTAAATASPTPCLLTGPDIYPSGGTHPQSLAVGDLDNDGLLDIVVANYDSYPDGVGVLKGLPDGLFGAPTTYSSGGRNPSSVAVGDFNVDGLLDIVVANLGSYPNNIAILSGLPSGGFGPPTTYRSGGRDPSSVAVGDLDGDGLLDIVVAGLRSHNVGVLKGLPGGIFGPTTTYQSGGLNPISVAVGDFNGDDRLDIVVANYSSYNVGVLSSLPGGGFSPSTTYPSGGTYPRAVDVGDLDGDGLLDILVANYASHILGVLKGLPGGSFSTPTTYSPGGLSPISVAVGDLDGDGLLDIVVANRSSPPNNIAVLKGLPGGGFSPPTTYPSGGIGVSFVVLGDFDGDGRLDIAVANRYSNTVAVLLNHCGNPGPTATNTSTPTVIPTATSTPTVTSTPCLLAGPVTYSSGGIRPDFVTTGDLDNDGLLDLVVANFDSHPNNIGVLKGLPGGVFGPPTTYPSGGRRPRSVAIRDLDGDGLLDMAVANYGTGSPNRRDIGVLKGLPGGGFGTPTNYLSGGLGPASIDVEDLDGDGRLDIVVANLNASNIGVLKGLPGGIFSSPTTYPSGATHPVSMAVDDLDGDGLFDLVVAHAAASPNNIGVLKGLPGGVFSSPTVYSSGGTDPRSVAVGDLDQDGLLDLVTANFNLNTVGVLRGLPSGVFSSPTTYPSGGTNPVSVAVGDLDGDGGLDIVVANPSISNIGVLKGLPGGVFSSPTTYPSGGMGPRFVAMGDLDGDGGLDVVTANINSDNIGVLLNQCGGPVPTATNTSTPILPPTSTATSTP